MTQTDTGAAEASCEICGPLTPSYTPKDSCEAFAQKVLFEHQHNAATRIRYHHFREWLLELDRKHSGRQGAIWHEIAKTFKLFG